MPGCAMGNCRNYSSKSKGQGIIYHSFPQDAKRRKLWVLKCKRKDKINVCTASVCSEHFSPDDYMRDLKAELLGCKPRKVLKPTAVPESKPPLDPSVPLNCPRREGSKLLHRGLGIPPPKSKVMVEKSNDIRESIPLKSESSIKEIIKASPTSLSTRVVTKPLVIKLSNNTVVHLPLKKLLKSRAEASLVKNDNVPPCINTKESNHSANLGMSDTREESSSSKKDIDCSSSQNSDLSTPFLKKSVSNSVQTNNSGLISNGFSNINFDRVTPVKNSSPLVPSIAELGKDHTSKEKIIHAENSDPGNSFTVSQNQILIYSCTLNHEKSPDIEQDRNCSKAKKNVCLKKIAPLPAAESRAQLDKVRNTTNIDSDYASPLSNVASTAIGLLLNDSTTRRNDIKNDECDDHILAELYEKNRKRSRRSKRTQTGWDPFDPKLLLNRIKWLEHKVQTLNNAVATRDARIKNLRSVVATSKKSVSSKVHEILGKLFTPSQIHCIETGKRCRTWHPDTLSQAIALRSISKKAYNFLRKDMGFPFPGLTAIKGWIRKHKKMEKEPKISEMEILKPQENLSLPSVETLETNCEFRELTIEVTTATE